MANESDLLDFYARIRSMQAQAISSVLDELLTHLEDPHTFIEKCRTFALSNPHAPMAGYYVEAADKVERFIAEGVYK